MSIKKEIVLPSRRFSSYVTPCRMVVFCLSGMLLPVLMARAQNSNPTSATNTLYGSVVTKAATTDVQPLALDDAVRMGLEYNLNLTLAQQNQRAVSARTLQGVGALLPDITLTGETGIHQYNLAAQGFSPQVIQKILNAISGGSASLSGLSLTPVVKVTKAQVNFTQSLFNWSAIDLYRAAKSDEVVAFYQTQSSRGAVVEQVSGTYLQALSAAAQVDNSEALLRADEVLLRQAVEEHKAGTVANLDELRARVTYQTQQQAVIAAQNNLEKTLILLKREIGLPAEQKVALTDVTPYADLPAASIAQAKQTAYANRQDWQAMQAQVRSSKQTRQAAKHERFPSLSFNGNYGVTGVTDGLYHGTFVAQGNLNVPLFQEAKFRGDREVADSQLANANDQLDDLRSKIDAQLRSSLLDVQTTAQLVQVARSNVELATKTLEQVTDRFTAGIDDNLPVVQAQSTLASAQSQLVNSLYQFNQAKLGLARHLGIVETQYKVYLGR